MLNKFIALLRKDVQIQKSFIFLLVVLCLLVFLKTLDYAQEKALKQLQAKKTLIFQIPELQKQLNFSSQGISLSGIILNKEMRVAIINNAIAKEGDMVTNQIKVISIKSGGVILNDGIKDFELKLSE